MATENRDKIKHDIRKAYGAIATGVSPGTSDTAAPLPCCGEAAPTIETLSKLMGYSDDDLVQAPQGANMGLGCGNPGVVASMVPGETVLDLGSGGGFDCFLARRQVGEHGRVIGIDMTPRMIELARTNASKLGYANVEFVEGSIESLPVDDDSIDVVISNCVINLSLDKARVFREAFRVLKPGGRLAVSDVVATAELPDVIKQDLKLHAGCVAGAEQVSVVERLLAEAGFIEIKLTQKDKSREILTSWVPGSNIDQYVASYVIEAMKPR